jgi:hypothetical protein
MHDLLDPRTWTWLDEADLGYRLYLDVHCEKYALLDYVDYQWAIQWCWKIKCSRGRRKWYAIRNGSIDGRSVSIYLHVQVMLRTGIARPDWPTVMVDHRDGDSMNCRRGNLRWATPKMNRANLYGQCPYDLLEDL